MPGLEPLTEMGIATLIYSWGATASPSLVLSPALEDNMRFQQQTGKHLERENLPSLPEITPFCHFISLLIFIFSSQMVGTNNAHDKESSLSLPVSRNKQMEQMKDLVQSMMV